MAEFKFKKLVKASEKWFSPAAKEWQWESPRADLRAILATRSPNKYGAILSRVSTLAAWHARLACVSIGNGDVGGWKDMRRYFDYTCQYVRLRIDATRLRGNRAPHDADPTFTPFRLLGMALAFRDSEVTEWLGEIVVESRSSRLLGHAWGSERRDPFRCYLCELYLRGQGRSRFHDNFGPYNDIFRFWSDPVALRDAIRVACDYHVAQIKVSSPGEIGVFEDNPHDIFPSELLALYRVREKLGLETPAVSHPLLDTPFTEMPGVIHYELDPLVQESLELARELLPSVVAMN